MTLQAPLTPADCDLRGYEFMPLFGTRLYTSEFNERANDAEFRAAHRLWWAAWQQCPAGSLPDNDDALCRYADLGRDTRAWKRVKEIALWGFVKCSDGRLYHPVLCEEAIIAYRKRVKARQKKADFRLNSKTATYSKETKEEVMSTGTSPPKISPTTEGQNRDVPPDRDRTETGQKEDKTSLRSVPQKRKTRVDPAWSPSPQGLDAARDVGMSDIESQIAQFRDYHAAKGNLMVDWDAAWRTWCRNSAQFSRRVVPLHGKSSKLAWMREQSEDLNIVPSSLFGD